MATASQINELPGITEIGCGYDVNGDYASTLSIMLPLFDLYSGGETCVNLDPQMETSTFRMPSSVTFHRSGTTEYSYAAELLKSLNSKVSVNGPPSPFSLSVSVDFDASDLSSRSYNFSRVQYNVNLYTLQLGTLDEMKEMLAPRARSYINFRDPDDLFDNYGCYFVASLVMGGRSVMGSCTSKYSFQATRSLEAAAKASFSSLLGAGVGSDTTVAASVKQFVDSSKVSITTKGGDSQYGSALPDKFQEWSQSVQQFPIFVDFLNARSLRGIWELADTPERAQVLRDAALEYLKKRSNTIEQHEGPLLEGRWVPLVRCGSSHRSGSKKKVAFWKPNLGRNDTDWYYLHQVAYPDHADRSQDKGLVVRELVKGVLGDIGDWTRIWDNRRSPKCRDYGIWQPVGASTVSYVSLGSVFKGQARNRDPPTDTEAVKLKVVHRSLVRRAQVDDKPMWDDRGTWAKRDASVWAVRGDSATAVKGSSGRGGHAFVGSSSYTRADRPVFTIKPSAIVIRHAGRNVDDIVGEQIQSLESTFGALSVQQPSIVASKVAPKASPAAYCHYKFNKLSGNPGPRSPSVVSPK